MSNLVKALLAFGVLLVAWGLWIFSSPEGHYPAPGHWERIPGDMSHIRTILYPGQIAAYEFSTQSRNGSEYCAFFDAERGRNSLSLTVQTAPMVNGATWQEINANSHLCFVNRWVRIEVSSNTRQTFRLATLGYQFSNIPRSSGYVPNLCGYFSNTLTGMSFGSSNSLLRRCAQPIPAAAHYPTLGDVNWKASQRMMFGTFLLIAAGVLHVGPFVILSAVFPSRSARRARDEIRKSGNVRHRYESNVNEPYRKKAKTPFQRKQDIDDLKDLIAETKRQALAIDNDLKKKQADEAAYQRKIAELDAAVERVKKLKEEIKRREAQRKS